MSGKQRAANRRNIKRAMDMVTLLGKSEKVSIARITRECNCSRSTAYRWARDAADTLNVRLENGFLVREAAELQPRKHN